MVFVHGCMFLRLVCLKDVIVVHRHCAPAVAKAGGIAKVTLTVFGLPEGSGSCIQHFAVGGIDIREDVRTVFLLIYLKEGVVLEAHHTERAFGNVVITCEKRGDPFCRFALCRAAKNAKRVYKFAVVFSTGAVDEKSLFLVVENLNDLLV